MHTLRRKSQIYPVAFAISLLFACHAHAQLCLTAAERSGTTLFAEQIHLGTQPEKTNGLVRQNQLPAASQTAQTLTTSTVSPRAVSSQPATAEVSVGNFLPPAATAQNAPASSNRSQGDLVRSLVLAGLQPMPAAAGQQLLFAE